MVIYLSAFVWSENLFFITLPGFPTTIDKLGTSFKTTAFEPIIDPFPIITPVLITAFAPIQTSSSITDVLNLSWGYSLREVEKLD